MTPEQRLMGRRAIEARYGRTYQALSAGGEWRWYKDHPTEELPDAAVAVECLARAADVRRGCSAELESAKRSTWAAVKARHLEDAAESARAVLGHLANARSFGPCPLP